MQHNVIIALHECCCSSPPRTSYCLIIPVVVGLVMVKPHVDKGSMSL